MPTDLIDVMMPTNHRNHVLKPKLHLIVVLMALPMDVSRLMLHPMDESKPMLRPTDV